MNPEKNQNDGPLKSLRTYQGDIESLMGKEKTSIVNIAMAEQKRELERPETKIEPEREGPGFFSRFVNKSFVAIGVGLLVCGVGIVGAVLALKYFSAPATVAQTSTLISFTKESNIAVASSTRARVVQAILTEEQSFNQPANSVLYLETDTDSQTFIQTLAPNIPPVLLRSLDTPYMLGAYVFNGNIPFIVLTSSDYASSFSGMLAWEKTMSEDLAQLFQIPANTSTTTPYVFTDESISNHDLRIVKDQTGKTVLLYSFLNKNTILITANEDIFSAILGKFVTSQLVR